MKASMMADWMGSSSSGVVEASVGEASVGEPAVREAVGEAAAEVWVAAEVGVAPVGVEVNIV